MEGAAAFAAAPQSADVAMTDAGSALAAQPEASVVGPESTSTGEGGEELKETDTSKPTGEPEPTLDWFDAGRRLQRCDELLKPYLNDPTQKDSAVVQALVKAHAQLELNAVAIHDAQRWARATTTLPKSEKHAVHLARSALSIQALDAGITKVVEAYESLSAPPPPPGLNPGRDQETRAHDHGPRGSAKDGDAKMAALSGGSDSGGSEEQSNSEDAKKEEAESAMETTGDQVVGEDAAPSGAEGAPPAGPLSAPQTKMMPSVSPVLTETAQLAPPETVVEVSAAPPTSVSLEKPEHESSDDPMNVDDLI